MKIMRSTRHTVSSINQSINFWATDTSNGWPYVTGPLSCSSDLMGGQSGNYTVRDLRCPHPCGSMRMKKEGKDEGKGERAAR